MSDPIIFLSEPSSYRCRPNIDSDGIPATNMCMNHACKAYTQSDFGQATRHIYDPATQLDYHAFIQTYT